MNRYFLVAVAIFILIVSTSHQSFAEQNGTVKIKVQSQTEEPVDYHGLFFKVYRDGAKIPTMTTMTENPQYLKLPIGHKYTIELYAGGMFAEVQFLDLDSSERVLTFHLPSPGSARFDVMWSDGYTPINGAKVSIRSGDGEYRYWTNSTTNQEGSTIRYWLQPTIADDEYYVAEVYVNDLMYELSPIIVNPGKSQDIKIVTPWPKTIDQLITVTVYKSKTQKLSGLDANLTVDLYGGNSKIIASKVTDKGDAYFSNIKIGKYSLRLINHDLNEQLGSLNVTFDGKTEPLKIFASQYDTSNQTESSYDVVSAITNSTQVSADPSQRQKMPIPPWIKNVAGWWADDSISDREFLKAIEYLVNSDIINVKTND